MDLSLECGHAGLSFKTTNLLTSLIIEISLIFPLFSSHLLFPSSKSLPLILFLFVVLSFLCLLLLQYLYAVSSACTAPSKTCSINKLDNEHVLSAAQ